MTAFVVHLQGRVAEELIYGKENVTDGASSDISNATQIASNMVRRFGFSEAIGPVAHMNDSDQPSPSEETQKLIDGEIKGLIEKAQDRAREVLTAKKDELERLARALVEYETLDSAEVQKGECSSFAGGRTRAELTARFPRRSHQGRADPADRSRVNESQGCVTMYFYARNSSLSRAFEPPVTRTDTNLSGRGGEPGCFVGCERLLALLLGLFWECRASHSPRRSCCGAPRLLRGT